MKRNQSVFFIMRIRYASHATISFDGWNEVSMKIEHDSKGMRGVIFLIDYSRKERTSTDASEVIWVILLSGSR